MNPLVKKLATLSKHGDPTDLFFAAMELRDQADGDPKLLAAALDGFRAAAKQGEVNAAKEAGMMLLSGDGVEADPRAALALFAQAGEGGNSAGALYAARLHRALTKDFAAARRFAALASDEHNPDRADALYLQALMAFHGEGAAVDKADAFALHLEAAELGHADAMFEVAVLLGTGQGVAKNEKKALAWTRRAAEAGQHRALYNLGAYAASGTFGMKQDLKAAHRWYEAAAAAGNGQAAGTLALMSLKSGGETSIEVAMPYLLRARELDFDVASLMARAGMPREVIATLMEVVDEF